MSSVVMGYNGLYKQPYPNERTYGDTIYAVTDDKHQEMNIILLTTGAYKDAYVLASDMTYQYINIFVPSLDITFISDVYRLYMDLLKIKKHLKWVFPDNVPTALKTHVLFDIGHIAVKLYASITIPNLTIEYRDSGASSELPVYDIYVSDGIRAVNLCQYADEKKLKSLFRNKEFDEIHMQYNGTFYGGLTYKEALKLEFAVPAMLRANNFACRDEYLECTKLRYGTPGTRVYPYI